MAETIQYDWTEPRIVIDREVGFIDDVFRHAFWPAKEFFYDLLNVPFCKILQRPPQPSVRRQMWKDGLLTPPTVFAGPGRDESLWLQHYLKMDAPSKALLKRYVKPDIVYLCYEASPALLDLLDEVGVTYIDIRISPLRFMQDIVLALRSNSPGINAVLSLASMTRTDIECEAMMLMASYRHLERYETLPAPSGQPPVYFVGQTATDASIIVDQGYFRLENALPSLLPRIQGRDVVYLRHPSANEEHSNREIHILRQLAGSLKVSEEASYDILCSERPAEFLGISSGLLQECWFFGKPSTSLIPPVCPLFFPENGEPKAGEYFQITFDTFLSDKFWASMFTQQVPERRDTPRHMRQNHLRELHNVWWGYAPHKGRANDFTRSQTRELQEKITKLQGLTDLLFSMVGQEANATDSDVNTAFLRSWRWPDGAEVVLAPGGKVMKAGRYCGSWRQLAGRRSAIMISWHGSEWLDMAELAPDMMSLKCRNNIGSTFVVMAA